MNSLPKNTTSTTSLQKFPWYFSYLEYKLYTAGLPLVVDVVLVEIVVEMFWFYCKEEFISYSCPVMLPMEFLLVLREEAAHSKSAKGYSPGIFEILDTTKNISITFRITLPCSVMTIR